MLRTMVPDKDIEDWETMKHKIIGFDRKMSANASCGANVNQLARQPLHVSYPGSDEIAARQNQLNPKWSPFWDKSETKREEINSGYGAQTLHIECHKTVTWTEDKMKILEQMDLTVAIKAKLGALEKELETSVLVSTKPENLSSLFRKTGTDTLEKGEQLCDAERANLYDQSSLTRLEDILKPKLKRNQWRI